MPWSRRGCARGQRIRFRIREWVWICERRRAGHALTAAAVWVVRGRHGGSCESGRRRVASHDHASPRLLVDSSSIALYLVCTRIEMALCSILLRVIRTTASLVFIGRMHHCCRVDDNSSRVLRCPLTHCFVALLYHKYRLFRDS
jgi:hypothetical protein